MCITEYNEERVMDGIHAVSYEEGRAEDCEVESIEGIRNVIKIVLDFGEDTQSAVTKVAERYQEDEEKIWKKRDKWSDYLNSQSIYLDFERKK